MWADIRPMLDESCKVNEVCETEIEVDDILVLMAVDQCTVVAVVEDGKPLFVLALQFTLSAGKRGANVLAIGGTQMLRMKSLYWEHFLAWLRANKVEFLDAYVPNERQQLYQKRLGFDKSCSFIRKLL
jgi:hypothetical protein